MFLWCFHEVYFMPFHCADQTYGFYSIAAALVPDIYQKGSTGFFMDINWAFLSCFFGSVTLSYFNLSMQYMNKLINKYSAKLDSESLDAA